MSIVNSLHAILTVNTKNRTTLTYIASIHKKPYVLLQMKAIRLESNEIFKDYFILSFCTAVLKEIAYIQLACIFQIVMKYEISDITDSLTRSL